MAVLLTRRPRPVDGRHRGDPEPVGFARRPEVVQRAKAPGGKTEVLANHHVAGIQSGQQDIRDEFRGRQPS